MHPKLGGTITIMANKYNINILDHFNKDKHHAYTHKDSHWHNNTIVYHKYYTIIKQ